MASIVKERYHVNEPMGPGQLKQLYNDLYVHLLDEMKAGIKQAADGSTNPNDKLAHKQQASVIQLVTATGTHVLTRCNIH